MASAYEQADLLTHWGTDKKEYQKEFLLNATSAEIEVWHAHEWKPLPLEYPIPIFVLFCFYLIEKDEDVQVIALPNETKVRSGLFTDAKLCGIQKNQNGDGVVLIVDAGKDCRFRFVGQMKQRLQGDVHGWL